MGGRGCQLRCGGQNRLKGRVDGKRLRHREGVCLGRGSLVAGKGAAGRAPGQRLRRRGEDRAAAHRDGGSPSVRLMSVRRERKGRNTPRAAAVCPPHRSRRRRRRRRRHGRHAARRCAAAAQGREICNADRPQRRTCFVDGPTPCPSPFCCSPSQAFPLEPGSLFAAASGHAPTMCCRRPRRRRRATLPRGAARGASHDRAGGAATAGGGEEGQRKRPLAAHPQRSPLRSPLFLTSTSCLPPLHLPRRGPRPARAAPAAAAAPARARCAGRGAASGKEDKGGKPPPGAGKRRRPTPFSSLNFPAAQATASSPSVPAAAAAAAPPPPAARRPPAERPPAQRRARPGLVLPQRAFAPALRSFLFVGRPLFFVSLAALIPSAPISSPAPHRATRCVARVPLSSHTCTHTHTRTHTRTQKRTHGRPPAPPGHRAFEKEKNRSRSPSLVLHHLLPPHLCCSLSSSPRLLAPPVAPLTRAHTRTHTHGHTQARTRCS